MACWVPTSLGVLYRVTWDMGINQVRPGGIKTHQSRVTMGIKKPPLDSRSGHGLRTQFFSLTAMVSDLPHYFRGLPAFFFVACRRSLTLYQITSPGLTVRTTPSCAHR